MAHPAIKAGLTHCGMGGTLEFINASIPSVCWPHFADQHDLAVIMEKQGIGKILYNKERMVKDFD